MSVKCYICFVVISDFIPDPRNVDAIEANLCPPLLAQGL